MKPKHLPQKIMRELLLWIRTERHPVGYKLVTSRLATQFGVSRTPVLAALDLLVEAGVIGHDKNRGYHLAVTFEELEGMLASLPDTEIDELYAAISQQHFRHGLGELSEAELMRRFETTRAMLHKCLSRIQVEGWAERNEGQGWHFIEVVSSAEAFQESYEFRLLNEPAALRSARFAPNLAELDKLIAEQQFIHDQGYEKLTPRELYDANIRFHETLMSWANNRFTLNAIQRLNQQRRLVEYQQVETQSSRQIQSTEHLDILHAIQKGEYDLAATRLTQHIQRANRTKLPTGVDPHNSSR